MIASALAAASRLISGATVQWRCDPYGSAQRIYFGNHASHLDFVVIWSALPQRLRRQTRPVAGRDYWDRGMVRRYLARRVFHAVLIERTPAAAERGIAGARASIEFMAEAMGTHDSLIVFPEGTRSVSGEVAPFKSGIYHLARRRPDVELIPVLLENLNRILPKGEALPVPMLSRVVFGPPLTRLDGEAKNQFLERARAALIGLRS
jgi:1-acyl-sn-glycerol-3-phosphate acyltransferase